MITAKEVKKGRKVVRFADGHSVELVWLKQQRQYLVLLSSPTGEVYYGWHRIPQSCMSIPSMCSNWKRVQWALHHHAVQHGGLEV